MKRQKIIISSTGPQTHRTYPPPAIANELATDVIPRSNAASDAGAIEHFFAGSRPEADSLSEG